MREENIEFIQAKQLEINNIVSNKLQFNNKLFNHRNEYYRIQRHVDEFLKGKYYNRFISMPGLRGVGKTTILHQLYSYLINEKSISSQNILYIDMADLKFHTNTNLLELFETFLESFHNTSIAGLDEKIFLFVDEAHFDENWAMYGKLIYDKTDNVFMIFTGSSALELETNADTIRRIKKEYIYPCNFADYLNLKYDIEKPNDISESLSKAIFNPSIEQIESIKEDELNYNLKVINSNVDMNIEFNNFLISYGFPFCLELSTTENYLQINDIITRIIQSDIPSLQNFKTSTNTVISKVITYLGTQKSGGTSNIKIANNLGVSPKTINDILKVLEKTGLVFSLKPYGTGGKILKKPWEYFFISPSIKAAINFNLGRYSLEDKKCLATLSETLVISAIYKLNQVLRRNLGLFYDPNKKGVDFLVKDFDRIIPIEVGIGKKTKSQLKIAMNNYKSDYGILVSNRTPFIEFKNDIMYIPLKTFGLL